METKQSKEFYGNKNNVLGILVPYSLKDQIPLYTPFTFIVNRIHFLKMALMAVLYSLVIKPLSHRFFKEKKFA